MGIPTYIGEWVGGVQGPVGHLPSAVLASKQTACGGVDFFLFYFFKSSLGKVRRRWPMVYDDASDLT